MKFPALTPVPEYVPPAGKPPVNVKGVASTQTSAYAARVTAGISFTVIFCIAKSEQDEELTACEAIQYRSHFLSIMKSVENTHYQFQLGVLPDEYWESARRTVMRYLRRHTNRQGWVIAEASFTTSFVEQVNNIIQEIEQEEATA